MGKGVLLSLVLAAVAALIGERIVNLRRRALASRELVVNHLPNCVLLPNLNAGSEDITVLGNGLAFISTGLKVPGMPQTDEPGKIFILDVKDPQLKPSELRMPRNFDLESFNPHGISVYTDPTDDTVYLFVINHPQYKSQVEVFKFVEADSSLVHLKTIKHELLHSLNDIVAVGVDSFYATNDHYFTNPYLKEIELFLSLGLCTVVYASPEEVKVVSKGYYFLSGINMSPDKRHIYVADPLDHNVHVLERKEDNELEHQKAVAVHSVCDNIEVDPETGDLWIGSHPNAWNFRFNDGPVGSEVLKVQNIHSDQPVVKQVYADDGHVIKGSTVATAYRGKLLIGTAFHRALRCDLE